MPCDSVYPGCTEYQRNLVPGWGHGKTFGYLHITPGYYFQSWQPGQWNSFCFTASSCLKQCRVFVNGEEMVEVKDCESEHTKSGKNIKLLNSFELKNPGHGSLTELTVWSRVLSEREVTDWATCGTVSGQTVVDWDTAELEVKGLQVEEVDRAEICSDLKKRAGEAELLVFDESRTFDGILSFCASLGGQMAVSRDNSSFLRMMKLFGENCGVTEEYFYSGHTDRENHGVWRDVNTGLEMAWSNWGEDNPTNLQNDNCAFAIPEDGKIYNYDCVSEAGNTIFLSDNTILLSVNYYSNS